MPSFRSLATQCTLLSVLCLLSAVQAHPAKADPWSHHLHPGLETLQKRENSTDRTQNGQNIYGVGVRWGSYLQGAAYAFSFATVDELEPGSQFSGILLSLQLLVRWWTQHNDDGISIPELWIGLAQLLLLTTPGAFLLFLSFSYRRRHWKTQEGRWLQRKEAGIGGDNPIWLCKNWLAQDRLFQCFVWIQFLITIVLEAIPYLIYLRALISYVHDWWHPKRTSLRDQDIERSGRWPGGFHHLVQKLPKSLRNFGHVITKFVMFAATAVYVIVLIVSIEFTIKGAGLNYAGNIRNPGQLLPFLTGVVTLVATLANLTKGRSLTETAVRREIMLDEGHWDFYKDGKAPIRRDYQLLEGGRPGGRPGDRKRLRP